MSFSIKFGEEDMMRCFAGTDVNASYLDPTCIFSGKYRSVVYETHEVRFTKGAPTGLTGDTLDIHGEWLPYPILAKAERVFCFGVLIYDNGTIQYPYYYDKVFITHTHWWHQTLNSLFGILDSVMYRWLNNFNFNFTLGSKLLEYKGVSDFYTSVQSFKLQYYIKNPQDNGVAKFFIMKEW